MYRYKGRVELANYVSDVDNLGRRYIHCKDSPYSEDHDRFYPRALLRTRYDVIRFVTDCEAYVADGDTVAMAYLEADQYYQPVGRDLRRCRR